MKKHNRVAVLTATAAILGLALSACGAAGQVQTQAGSGSCSKMYVVKYHAFPSSLNNTVAKVAESKGFFRENCITPEAVTINSAPAAFQQSVAGTVNFVNTAPDNAIIARGNGLDVKIVGNQFSRLYYSLVVSNKYPELKDKPFDEVMAALQGKKIGVTVLGGNNEFITRANFAAAGLDPTKATYVALGASSSSIASLTNGTVDAAELYGNAQDIAVAQGLGFIVNDTRIPKSAENPVPESIAKLQSTLTWAAQTKFMNENPEATKGFVSASDKAVTWIQDPANRSELYELLKGEAPVPGDIKDGANVFRASVDIYADQVSSELTETAMNDWITFVKSFAQLKSEVQASDIIHNPGQ